MHFLIFINLEEAFLMKKTLIALAVAVSTISGAAMAADWEPNSIGGPVNFGGALTQAELVTPWEVKVGDGNTHLDALIRKGDRTTVIDVGDSIPVLSIRVRNSTFFGMAGISPNINFGNAVDFSKAVDGITTLELDVTDATTNKKIGAMSVPFYSGGVVANRNKHGSVYYGHTRCNNASATTLFCGGLGTYGKADKRPVSNLNSLSTEILAKFDSMGADLVDDVPQDSGQFTAEQYSAAYGAGILPGSRIEIRLDAPVADSAINWRAQLPITISYK